MCIHIYIYASMNIHKYMYKSQTGQHRGYFRAPAQPAPALPVRVTYALCQYICIYIYIYVYIYIYAYKYKYKHIHVCIHTYIYV